MGAGLSTKAGQGGAGQGMWMQGRAWRCRAGHGDAGQGMAGQGMARQGRACQNRAGQTKPDHSTSKQHGQEALDCVLTKPRPTPCRKTMGRVSDSCCLADSSADTCPGLWIESDPRGPDVGSRTQYDIPCASATPTWVIYIVLPRCAAEGGWVGVGGGECKIAMTAGEGQGE